MSREEGVKQNALLLRLRKDSEQTYSRLQGALVKLSEYNIRNVNKRIKRRDEKIKAQENEMKTQESDLQEKDSLIREKDEEIQKLTSVVKVLQEKLDKEVKSKNHAQQIKSHYKSSILRSHLLCDEDSAQLEEKLTHLEAENRELHDTMKKFLDSDEVETFEDGKFKDEVRQVYMILLSMDTGLNNIEFIIRTILDKLGGLKCGKLPKYATAQAMFAEARRLSQVHVADVVSKSTNITVGTDGTTKKHDKYGSVSFFTQDGTLVAGVTEQLSGKTEHQVDMFKKIIHELSTACGKSEDEMWLSVKNTMSDRHVVNKCLNKQLEDIREEALKNVVKEWDNKSTEDKEKMKNMWNHFCSMHYIVGLATSAEVGLKKFENASLTSSDATAEMENSCPSQAETGTHRLVRATCKAFSHTGACEKSGHPKEFEAYLQSCVPAKDNKLISFRGERFNVLFKNGGATYHHRNDLLAYLDTCETPNRLLQAVRSDLCVSEYVAGCRALGMINKVVTAPLWRLIESEGSILDMCQHFHQLHINFTSWEKDPSTLMDGEAIFPSVQNPQCSVYKSLFSQSHDDPRIRRLTCQALKSIMTEFLVVTERMLKDYLPGGIFHNPTEEQREEMASCPTNNTGLERTFAHVDRDVRLSPNATTLTREGKIMFRLNRTGQYLDTIPTEKKHAVFKEARKTGRIDRKLHQQERLQLKQHRQELLRERTQKQAMKKAAKEAALETLKDSVRQLGVWETAEHIEAGLSKLFTKKARLQALKQQIKFQKEVLGVGDQHPKSLFQFSKGRKIFQETDLKNNLLAIIRK
ncbi:Hypp5516 [Branchiostoma lanceolatum]|uniref:Hypp5516 protein n=1 Tax=Branchiostoma lanceolatum TaxID=7740 RepID=A0A8J9VE09_BRALA|nr:Hypp5516 [Branchiostoma lanceolatum]